MFSFLPIFFLSFSSSKSAFPLFPRLVFIHASSSFTFWIALDFKSLPYFHFLRFQFFFLFSSLYDFTFFSFITCFVTLDLFLLIEGKLSVLFQKIEQFRREISFVILMGSLVVTDALLISNCFLFYLCYSSYSE